MPLIHLTTVINAPIEVCFDQSRSIEIHKQSMSASKEKAVGGKTSGLIGLNEMVTWEATHFFVRQKLSVRITEFDFPIYFKDEMIAGAFRSMKHEHLFHQKSDSTIMEDRFFFESPYGLIGWFFNKMILTNYMTRLLTKRNDTLKQICENGNER